MARIAVVCSSICLLGIVIRLTVRDQIRLFAPLYYATPLVVLSALAIVAVVVFVATRRWRWAKGMGIVGCLCLVGWWQTSYHRNDGTSQSSEVRVLFWNVARGAMGWSSVARDIRRCHAPLIGLVESGPNLNEMLPIWQAEFPMHHVELFDGGMALLVRGTVLKSNAGPLGKGGRYARAELLLDERRLTVVIVDFKSNPLRSRREPMLELMRLLSASGEGPMIVMGDFNTPSDSVFFELLRGDFDNAFELAGHGFSSTWPVPLPVLDIDQVWVDRSIRVHRCEARWSRYSDHRQLVTDLSIVGIYSVPPQ